MKDRHGSGALIAPENGRGDQESGPDDGECDTASHLTAAIGTATVQGDADADDRKDNAQ